MPRPPRLAPSILSADLGHLAREIQEVEHLGADWIHIDVVDGHFAPFITFGPLITGAARAATQLPLDVHLMVSNPERHLDAFAAAGADILTVHGEACHDLGKTLQRIRALGKRAGVALRPETPASLIAPHLAALDLVLVLCVQPGKSGQAFDAEQLVKIAELRRLIDQAALPIDIEVDGGVSPKNAAQIIGAGGSVLVAGSQIFGAKDRRAALDALRRPSPAS